VPGAEGIPYLCRLGNLLAVASGAINDDLQESTSNKNSKGKDMKNSASDQSSKVPPALTALDAAMCNLIDVLDTFTD
jgi:hypothetical protein